MAEYAKLIEAIAALLNAILWPTLFISMAFMFRKPLASLAAQLPMLPGRLEKVNAWGLDLTLRRAAKIAESHESIDHGRVSSEQLKLSAEIEVDANDFGEENLLFRLDRLCRQYDVIRRTMSAGGGRTRKMAGILVQMRVLAPATAHRIDVYKSSASAGSRLAAVAMMQMELKNVDISWLSERFVSEQPFVFYHAALALHSLADQGSMEERQKAVDVAREALTVLGRFEGKPDWQTIDVLKSIIDQS